MVEEAEAGVAGSFVGLPDMVVVIETGSDGKPSSMVLPPTRPERAGAGRQSCYDCAANKSVAPANGHSARRRLAPEVDAVAKAAVDASREQASEGSASSIESNDQHDATRRGTITETRTHIAQYGRIVCMDVDVCLWNGH